MPPGPYPRSPRAGSRRTSPLVALVSLLAIIGSLTLAANLSWDTSAAARTVGTTTALPHQRARPVTSQHTRVARTHVTHTVTRHATPASRPPAPHPTARPPESGASVPFLSVGNVRLPEIALTFDDGPNPAYTPQILAILQRFGLRATFFDVGRLVAAYPALARREYLAGHIVGDHTWSHPELTLLPSYEIHSQLGETAAAIQSATGVRPAFFRPPYGLYNNQVLAQANGLALTTVTWNVDSRDWTLPGVHNIVRVVLQETRNGSILLFHDGGGNRSETVAALPIIITDLEQRGYSFVTLQQMIVDR